MVEARELKRKPDLTGNVRAIQEDGYAYFPGVLTPDQVSELKAAMDRLSPIEESFNRYSTPGRRRLSQQAHQQRLQSRPDLPTVS